MPTASLTSWLRRAAAVATAVTLAACGDGDETRTLSGVAATGAPIVGGTVDMACAGGSLASGTAYRSFAFGAGTVNITPLTDLVVAQLAGAAPSAWFDQRSAADSSA